jgi:cytidylate kinase
VTVPVIAVDGPAGAGKSTASRGLAERLGFAHVDTGAMYRAVGVVAAERGVALDDAAALARLVDGLALAFPGGRVVADGRDVTVAIRTTAAGDLASRVSTQPVVRERLVALQRALGASGRVVMEGRDIGTVVFPDAALKFYLTADAPTRAARRARELRAAGVAVDEAALARDLEERDRRDAGRAHSPLRPAPDAVVVDTTPMALAAVVELMAREARARGLGVA